MRQLTILFFLALTAPAFAQPAAKKPDGNRLAYLDELDPYYPHAKFPKLITPQWVGEKDVEAVVVLAIDEMRDPKRYEMYLRPILRRLQQIDGRAPLSIMTNQVDPKDPQLQAWLKEGLSLECQTLDHPCPFFKGGFAKAKETYDKCVDLMNEIPNNKPVAFRMPCCDSLNTPSPRYWAEIFNQMTAKGNFLSIDSSVFNVFTSADPELPRELVLNEKGQERFRRYLPTDRTFVNTIENYPYPYVIGRLCWEFPCVYPSDWEAQHVQKPNNPDTVRDLKAALDCVVAKKGVFCLVFHPHGWIRNDQVVELIDHAVAKHGKKVKFLNFREAQERLDKNSLATIPVRNREYSRVAGARSVDWVGADNGVRVLDVNNDGYMDAIVQGSNGPAQARIWSLKSNDWSQISFPVRFSSWFHGNTGPGKVHIMGKRHFESPFGVCDGSGRTFVFGRPSRHFYGFSGAAWETSTSMDFDAELLRTFKIDLAGEDYYVLLLRDIDGDGQCELIIEQGENQFVARWSSADNKWTALPFKLPPGASLSLSHGPRHFAGPMFLDLNNDGKLDVIFSNEKEFGVYLFTDMERGWSKKIMAGKREDEDALPMISRDGTNNGCWVHSGSLWWSNEDTVLMKDHVDRRSFKELLGR